MKKKLVGLAACLTLIGSAGMASALTVDATITADNHYALYYGNGDGSFVDYVGRNEKGSAGSTGGNNWSKAETFNFNINLGDYIYVAGWSDNGTAQGWIGQFVMEQSTLLTNTSAWEVFLTHKDLNTNSDAPNEDVLGDVIGGVTNWNSVTNFLDHGVSPWGNIAGISQDADWIWGSAMQPGSGYGEYQLFRTRVGDPVPEPATMLLFGAGMAGLAGFSRKKKK